MEHRTQHGVARLAELAFGFRPAEELYDLKTDPHQMVNLAGAREHRDVQDQLHNQLFSYLESTRDPRVVGGKIDWDYYPYYGAIRNKDWKVDQRP